MYFTYNKAGEPVKGGQAGQRQSAITLFRARLDGEALTDVQELFMGDWQNGASGSRIAFGPNATLFITTGAPFGEQAQDPNTVYGKVLRLTDEGLCRRTTRSSGTQDPGLRFSRWATATSSD